MKSYFASSYEYFAVVAILLFLQRILFHQCVGEMASVCTRGVTGGEVGLAGNMDETRSLLKYIMSYQSYTYIYNIFIANRPKIYYCQTDHSLV